jgi:hypothetical protein
VRKPNFPIQQDISETMYAIKGAADIKELDIGVEDV